MSPISIKLFRSRPNPVELNGPILSFSQQPVSIAQTSGGSVTFTGIATATFPTQEPPIPNKNLGQIEYQWYEVGIGSISGANSTSLTISNLRTPTDSGRRFYLESRYAPSLYNPGIDLLTPKAINSPLNSDIVQVTVYPQVSIATQPQSQSVAIDNPATFSVQGTLTDSTQGSISYQWQINETNLSNGTVSLGSTTLTVSGANTQTLTISSNTVGINSIRALLTHPVAGNSPFYSNVVQFNTVEPRPIIKIEGYNDNSSTAVLSEVNLDDQELVLTPSSYNFDWICFYASEKDVEIEMDIYGCKGNNVGSFVGGDGGYSRIRLNLQKNDEHIISGIGLNDAIFVYRKSSLIAVVGSGGDAGTSGNGGAGGGINLSGSSAPNGGSGGSLVSEGSLNLTGIYGSIISQTTLYPGDVIENAPNGGKTITCSKGIYWRNQGKSPCQDLGVVKFRTSNGTELSNSALISRGFKSGYSITQTAGLKTVVGGGSGGSGATGGNGSTNNFGGGGGSGYSDGTFEIILTTIGGSKSDARVNLRLYDGGFYVDDKGRILILSCVDTRDPTTITKTTGIVLPGSNSCIDDVRWQNFLDLSRDGTKNYRLTGTNSNGVKVTTAANNNIYKMINSNVVPLRTSLTNWYNINYTYDLRVLAWDETDPTGVYGSDYSLLSWSPLGSGYGWGFYGESSNSFFDITIYNNTSVSYWILPPGVPDF